MLNETTINYMKKGKGFFSRDKTDKELQASSRNNSLGENGSGSCQVKTVKFG